MTAFADCCRIEQESLPRLVEWLDTQADGGRVVLTAKGRLSKFLQETIGDAVMQCDGKVYATEFKIEQRWTGNLFLETWSNLSRFNPGWLMKLDTDILLYYFADNKTLISVPFLKLKRWAWGGQGCAKRVAARSSGHIYDYPERAQAKHSQMNDTWGRLVPVEVVRDEVGAKVYSLSGLEDSPTNLFAADGTSN